MYPILRVSTTPKDYYTGPYKNFNILIFAIEELNPISKESVKENSSIAIDDVQDTVINSSPDSKFKDIELT